MNQQSQTKLLLGIGAITAVLIAGYFGLDYLTDKKTAPAAAAASGGGNADGEFASAISAATEGSTSGANLTEEDARRIGAEVARQVATEVAQSIVGGGGAAAGGGLTEEDARRIGAEEGRRVAEEVAAAAVQQALAASGGGNGGLTAEEAEQIGLAAGRRAAEQVAASTAREVVRKEFNGSVAVATKPDRAAASSDSGTTASTSGSAAATKSRKTAAVLKSPGTDALRAWWTAPSSGEFGLVYAGQAKGESAIALLFSGTPADSALNQSVKVYDAKGTLVSGNWEAAANPRLAVFRGLKPGRYTVVVEPSVADSSGKSLGKTQHGPVYIS